MALIVFCSTAFLSAFLLFQVQPLMGKAILPWFGGAPMVWTTCMMFFQTVLLLGYAYAHLLTTALARPWQMAAHLAVLAAGIAFAPVLPGADIAPDRLTFPTVYLLSLLAAHVGAPFFALSATAPLLQAWFARVFPDRSPYPLYAVSNAGSMVGVLLYPFVIEPMFSITSQACLWSGGFYVFTVLSALCGIAYLRRGTPPVEAVPPLADSGDVPAGSGWTWLSLSASGSVLLLATTDQISEHAAASPLFWMLPLALYLLSFVLSFARRRLYHRRVWLSLLPVAVGLMAAHMLVGGEWSMAVQTVLFGATLFGGCMVCHGELARVRPASRDLTRYFLLISLGGALGGLFVAVIAPLAFPRMWEYSLAWLALVTLMLVRLAREAYQAIHQGRAHMGLAGVALGWVMAAAVVFADVAVDYRGALVAHRSFFGCLAVAEKRDKRCLYHGRTLHGCQWKDPARAALPTTYFGPGSGVDTAVGVMRQLREGTPVPGLHIGVVGLGVGTVAAYGYAGDVLRFYEIDPDVVAVAEEWFSYLAKTKAHVQVVVGDARIALNQEAGEGAHPPFDVLVLDAFNGNAMPLHLLTREAFEVYRRRLEPDGILAINISNKQLDLESLVRGMADHMSQEALLARTGTDTEKLLYESRWGLITGHPQAARSMRDLGRAVLWPAASARTAMLTDQLGNILKLMVRR
jgi:hypothetical protein